MVYRLNADVALFHDEDANVWRYVTRWGDIRDVYGFIGSIAVHRCRFGHGLAMQALKDDAFSALYLAMHEYGGDRPVGEYASTHVCRALRAFIEANGDLRPGQSVMLVLTKLRVVEIPWQPRELPASLLNEETDFLDACFAEAQADAGQNVSQDRSLELLRELVDIAVNCGYLPACTSADPAVGEMYDLLMGNRTVSEVAQANGISVRTVFQHRKNLRDGLLALVNDGKLDFNGRTAVPCRTESKSCIPHRRGLRGCTPACP